MAKNESQQTEEILPPHVKIIQMSSAFLQSRVLYSAAEIGLADYLSEGPKRAEELAKQTDTDASSLHRLMRALAHFGILSMENNRSFSLTPLGEALQTGAPGKARSTILTVAGEGFWNAFFKLPETLEDGEPGFEKAFGMSFFEYIDNHPEMNTHFNNAMIGFHGAEPPAVAEAYDFSNFETVVDVGGGTGNMLATIYENYPGLNSTLFELPRVIEQASELLKKRGVADKITFKEGDFFEEVPEGGDAYILSHILHDWPRDRCLSILQNCREAMPSSSRLLIVEMVLPENGSSHPGYELDMVMLALTGGKERTKVEYDKLLNKAGFNLEQVIPTDSPVSIIEAVPA